MKQNIYSEPGQRGNANLQRVIDAVAKKHGADVAAAMCKDPDDYPGGPRVDGMTPHRAAIVEAWGKSS